VHPPAELVASLTGYVSGAGLQGGIATSLTAKLNAAQSDLRAGSVASAVQDAGIGVFQRDAGRCHALRSPRSASVTGEQFALPDAVALLRETRRSAASGQ